MRVRVVAYQVGVIPEALSPLDADTWAIIVEHTGFDRWAVRHRCFNACLNTAGEWDREPIPGERTEAWLDAHRFDIGTALDMAQKAAPHVTVNGMTAAQVLASHTQRGTS